MAVLTVGALAACGSPQGSESSSSSGCPANASEPIGDTIKLGSTMPLSGQLASVGQNRAGVEALVESVNAEGGIDGKKLELTVLDDKGDPARAVSNVQRLISQEDVDALIAVTTTPVNLAIGEFAVEQCVPNLFALTGDARFTAAQFKGMIPASDPYDTQAKALVEDIRAEAGEDATIGVLQVESDSGAGLTDSLKRVAEEAGMTVLPPQTVAPTDSAPPTSQIQALKDEADVLAMFLSPFQCPPALQALGRSGWETQVYVGDFCAYPSVLEPAGDLANGVRSVNWIVDPNDGASAERQDVKDYLAAVEGKAPPAAVTSFAETGYVSAAGAIAYIRSIAEDGELTRLELFEGVEAIEDLQVPLLFDGIKVRTSEGDVSPWSAVNIIEYQDGTYASIRQVAVD
ncbi:ABC transporter substrate-binding protein [Nocardioides humi]|uniref:ABC transporter substrate-binding protein n=1 Tax=Nocardioides humi TaxID=449461 RepID=UPI0015E875FA|nr:ABC transporter substrate-binding protein [Nocardioides humi]